MGGRRVEWCRREELAQNAGAFDDRGKRGQVYPLSGSVDGAFPEWVNPFGKRPNGTDRTGPL